MKKSIKISLTRPRLIAFVGVFLLLGVSIFFSLAIPPRGTPADQASYDNFFVAPYEEYLVDAMAQAEEWQSDAVLWSIHIFIYPSETRNWFISFNFRSESANSEYGVGLTGTAQGVKREADVYLLPANSDFSEYRLSLDRVKVNGREVFQVIHQGWGQVFVESHSDVFYPIILFLEPSSVEGGQIGSLQWRVRYSAGQYGLSAGLQVTIDAETGEPIKVRED